MTDRHCGCGAKIHRRNQSGRCVKCAAADPVSRAKKAAKSPELLAKLSANAKRMNSDPDIVAKRSATISKTFADPDFKAQHAEACRIGRRRAMNENPEFREALIQSGKRLQQFNAHWSSDPDRRAEVIRRQRRANMPWCPEDQWDFNLELKAKGFLLAERQEIILSAIPGTAEHARRSVMNAEDAQRIRHERDIAQSY